MPQLGDMLDKEQVKKVYDKAKPYNNRKGTKFPGKPFEKNLPNGLPAVTKRYPEHISRCTLLVRNNAEFKRLLGLAVQELHKDAGLLDANEKGYVKCMFNKYSLKKKDNLITEYSMKTKLFVTAFAAAILAFTKYCEHTLAEYINNEFDENPLTDEDIAKANEIVGRINVIPESLIPEETEE